MAVTDGSGASRAGDLHNEDEFLVSNELGLYVVCDGASEQPAGERASDIAVEAIERFVAEAEGASPGASRAALLSDDLAERAIRTALDAVHAAAGNDAALSDMSTTITMLLSLGERSVIGHIGDSRAYLIRNRRLEQITIDHATSEPLSPAPPAGEKSHDAQTASIDTFAIDLREGDVIVLCTDGATDAIGTNDTLIRTAHTLSPALLASRIVSAAHHLHPTIDATAVVVRVHAGDAGVQLSLSNEPRKTRFGYAIRVERDAPEPELPPLRRDWQRKS